MLRYKLFVQIAALHGFPVPIPHSNVNAALARRSRRHAADEKEQE
jgi:hypothetical protein